MRSGKRIKVVNLVQGLTKQDEFELVRKLAKYPGSEPLLLATFSCYSPTDGKMCGRCKACVRWFLAAEGSGKNPWMNWTMNKDNPIMEEYYLKTMSGRYRGRRAEQYKKVFKQLGW